MLAVLVFFLSLIFSMVGAVPTTAPKAEVVFNPNITSPTASFMWKMGSTHNITWRTSDIPSERISSRGMVLLGYGSKGHQHINISHPLAKDFPILTGWVSVTMPDDVEPREDYLVILFGDSGNVSPHFRVAK